MDLQLSVRLLFNSVETGNPVRIWDCPAAVSRNESRHKHWLSHELGSDGE